MANLTNKRRFVHEADKRREGEQDLMDKAKIARVMRGYFGLSCIYHDLFIGIHKRDRYWLRDLTKAQLDSNDFWPHKPDLIVTNYKRPLVIEIDGDVHFFKYRGLRKTNERNQHYELAGIGLIWLLSSEVQNTDTRLVSILADRLERYGIKPKTPPFPVN